VLVFLWSAWRKRLTFCVTFVLPLSALLSSGIFDGEAGNGDAFASGMDDGDAGNGDAKYLWIAAQTNGVANQIMTIISLIIAAPQLIEIAMLKSCRNTLIDPMYFVAGPSGVHIVMSFAALIGLIVSLIQQTPTFWFLATLFICVPGPIAMMVAALMIDCLIPTE